MKFREEVRVLTWLQSMWRQSIWASRHERGMRVLEEAMEVAQTLGVSLEDCRSLGSEVWSKPVGEFEQEIGGLMVCVRAASGLLGVDTDLCFEREMTRIHRPEVMTKIKAKQEAKVAKGLSKENV